MTKDGRRKYPLNLAAPYMGTTRVNRSGWVKRSQRYFCLGPEPLVHRPCLTDVRGPGLGRSGVKSMSSLGLSIPSHVDTGGNAPYAAAAGREIGWVSDGVKWSVQAGVKLV